jgi:hypothetical protein
MKLFRSTATSAFLAAWLLSMVVSPLLSSPSMPSAYAQSVPADSTEEAVDPAASPGPAAAPVGDMVALPTPSGDPPVIKAAPKGQYVLEFNRSPVVQDRLRFEGIYDEVRLWFTRPQNWEPQSVRVLLRYRHSAALYATRSNLTVLVNGTSIGSAPLNRKQGELGEVVFEIPARLIRDYNELVVAALQNNSPTCTQDPYDPSLWSEVLPDSKLVFDFQPQPVALNFQQYPYPLVDVLSLEPNRVTYLKPTDLDETWLTSTSRLQTSLGRHLEYRPLETRLVDTIDATTADESLVIIGTPATQPALADLELPLTLNDEQLVDQEGDPIAPEVGVLMLTTALDDQVPVLIATGNGPEGVAKATQFLVQRQDEAMATGQVIIVNELTAVPSPEPRAWPDYLPTADTFQLRELKNANAQPFEDVTVWGSQAPALEFDFHALPDDRFLPGSTMNLTYSYGPQINPLTSQVEVTIDGVAVGGERLRSEDGAQRETIKLDLPPQLIKPHSKMQVNFRLDPRERRSCSRVTDQQLWGTIHADTEFTLQREAAAWLPNLKLLQHGFPFAAPQDLSQTAIALPDTPSDTDLHVMLEISERLGRLSQADSVQLTAFRVSELPDAVRGNSHLIAIGTQAQFPLAEVFEQPGFQLSSAASRQFANTRIQILQDEEGMVKQVRSPWNKDKVLLALSAQTPTGLERVRELLDQDSLFYQLEGDTVLISANLPNPDAYDPKAYNVTVLQETRPQKTSLETRPNEIILTLQRHWMFISAGSVVASLIFYGIAQHVLRRLAQRNV